MAYPHKWLPIGYRSSAGQWSPPAKRPTFYRYSMQPKHTVHIILRSRTVHLKSVTVHAFRYHPQTGVAYALDYCTSKRSRNCFSSCLCLLPLFFLSVFSRTWYQSGSFLQVVCVCVWCLCIEAKCLNGLSWFLVWVLAHRTATSY